MSTGIDPHKSYDGRPAAQFSCLLGHTEHHVVFGLLHLALLGWSLYSEPWARTYMRGLTSGLLVFAAAFHALVGGLCSSTTVALRLKCEVTGNITV